MDIPLPFDNHAVGLKIALLVAVIALEVWSMLKLRGWRKKGVLPVPRNLGWMEAIRYTQYVLIAAIVVVPMFIARDPATIPVAPAVAAAVERQFEPVVDSSIATAPVVHADTVAVTPAPEPVKPLMPSGTETVTTEDLALLAREIAMPLDGIDPTTLHSNFDEKRGGGTRPHHALDIMSARRTPVKSAAKGRVLKLFTSVAGGLMVYAADSSERFILMYAHLDGYAPGMKDGVPLARGQLIGYVGSTGNASVNAPHLHFALARSADVKKWSKGTPVDPLPVLQAAKRQ
jgi:murein DD-endopeptidase MepM/ murein hydrolase activator NlpD